MTGPQRKRLLSIGVFGTLLTLLVLVAEYRGYLTPLERALYDIRVRRFQGFAKPPTDALIHVDIDDGALAVVGKWPWSRTTMAELIDEMSRAGAKVIVPDILFDEAAAPLLEEQPDGTVLEVDEDERLAKAIKRAGNVVLGASLSFPPPTPPDPVAEAVMEALVGNLELSVDDLVGKLASLQTGTGDDLTARVSAGLFARRGEAMRRRIKLELASRELASRKPASQVSSGQELASEESSGQRPPSQDPATQEIGTAPPPFEELRAVLLPNSPPRGTLATQLTDEYERETATRGVLRLALSSGPARPPLLMSDGGLVPIPSLSADAKAVGFVDHLPDADGVVRAIPLCAAYDEGVLPQISLAAACAAMDVDVRNVRLSGDGLIIPRPGVGDLLVPTRAIWAERYGRVHTFFDVPLFGRNDGQSWERMYDFPHYHTPKRRISAVKVWQITDTVRDIARNEAAAVRALAIALSKTDQDAADELAENPPKGPELDERSTDALDALDFHIDSLEKLTDPSAEERQIRDELKRVRPGVRTRVLSVREKGVALQLQLTAQRAELAAHLKGRAVFMGSIATGAYDFVPNSMDPRCPGVYMHSAAFSAIMTGEFWRRAPAWVTYLSIILLGVLTTVLIAVLSPPAAAVAVLLLSAAYAAVNGILVFDYCDLIVGAAGPLVAAGVVWSGVTLIQFIREIGERTRLTRRFRSYVDPTLVSYVIENPDQARLEAHERELTVAFTDLAGFTTLSEQLRAESAKMLGRYMETMVPLIRARGGYVNKFLGDGIMFFFGAPIENPRHAAGAVAAVLDMQAAIGPFNADLERRGLPTLAMRAGVSTGLMVVGDAGPSFASDYTVLGDAVNLAARLESANKAMGTQNLITGRTVDMLDGEYLTRPIANLQVVGKNLSVWVHEAVAPSASATDEHRRLVTMTAAIVESYGKQQFDACIQACHAFVEAFGPSKLADLYAAEAETCRSNPPDDRFCGLIKLQAK